MMNLKKCVYEFELRTAYDIRRKKSYICDAIDFDKLVKQWCDMRLTIGPAQLKIYRYIQRKPILVNNFILRNNEKPQKMSLQDGSWIIEK